MRKTALIVPAFALLSGAIAWGVLAEVRESRLEALLEEIEAAEHRVAYAGVREISAGDTITLKVLSAGDGRRHVEPASVRPRRPAFAGLLRPGLVQWKERVKDYHLAVRNYDIAFTGTEVVAGRLADLYEARPKIAGRPTFRVAADRVHRLALRFEVVAVDATRFCAEFKEISFPPASEIKIPPAAPPAASWLKVGRTGVPLDRISEAAGFGVWAPARPAAGFELRGSELIRLDVELPEQARRALPFPLPKIGGTVAHLAYTDGLAVVSVIEIDARSELWAFAKKFLPRAEATSSGILAQKVKGAGGWAYLLEVEGTAVLVAGNVRENDIESMIESLNRR
ncbi:MAG TPA: hypothetical protein VF950_04585 [Planctomycetota bacterium]